MTASAFAQADTENQSEADRYGRDGYLHIPALFPREVLIAFYRQMESDLAAQNRPLRSFVATGPLLGKPAIEVYAHYYRPMLGFLWGLTPRMAEATGRDLLPTYAYFRVYQQGDVCRVHSDRLACEHSLSLTIASGEDRPWGLSVGRDRVEPAAHVAADFEGAPFGTAAMRPGDGVVYQGVHRRHGRLDPNPNSWSAHLFLHWVDRDGPYADQAFDAPAIARASQG